MDQAINIPLNKILFNSKENIQLYSEKISSSTHFEQVHETNFHLQYKKNYGIKNREECLYEDLSKIQKQLAILSNISHSDSYKYNSSSNCSQKYCQKMLPENLHCINCNQKDHSSPEHSHKCHVMDKNENLKKTDHNNDVHVSNNSPSVSEQMRFLKNKSEFHQLTDSPQLVFSLNKLSDEKNTQGKTSCENIGSIISFSKSEPRKDKTDNGCDYLKNENQDENCSEEREDKLLKCKHLNYTAFEFEGDYSKDLDSSGLFEFSLEGEKIVSSLCGPQMKTLDKGGKEEEEESESNTLFLYNKADQELNFYEQFKTKSSPHKSNNGTLSKYLNAEMSFSSAVTSTPEKDNTDSLHKRDVIYGEMKPMNNSCEQISEINKATIEKENRFAGGDKLTIDNIPNEMKCVILQQMSTNCVEMRSGASYGTWMIGRIRPLENKECKGTKFEFCNQFNDSFRIESTGNNSTKTNQQQKVKPEDINKSSKSASVPNIFSMLNKFNQGDNCTITSHRDTIIQNSETKSEILDICDDEISFRKSAIKGCLVFERIIKDFHIITQEQDLENYCKTVKRYVSVASSAEKREFTVLISDLISGFLKLADSWGILNSYFGESGNCENKPQNLDDIKFYQSFQDWQVKSRTLLDHLTKVVQNLKEFIPKVDEKENKLFKESQISKLSEYNPFLNSIQLKSREINSVSKNGSSNSPSTQPQQKEESSKNQTSSPLLQEIQFPKNIANIFTAHNQNNNWKQNVSESNIKKPPEAFWELPQNNQQQNMFSSPSVPERKLRKKWSLTIPEFQSDSHCQSVPNQGIAMQQNQGSSQMPPINFQYVAQNKGPMENIMLQPFNLFGNQYNPLQHNIQNIRDNTAYNYGRPPTYYPNLKQSSKKKGNINFKPEEHFHKEIMNNNPVCNRVNMCNPQMTIPLLQNSVSPNPFGMMEEAKSNVIYPNFCITDGKTLATNTPYAANFFHNEVYQPNPIPNQNIFCHKTCDPKPMMSLPLNNGDGDDSSEEYYPIKSYMKPGSYRVPNKSKSLVLQTSNNLNYIFDDVLVTGITVPFTKTNIFSQTKKNINKPVSTIEKSIQTNRSDEVKNTDLVWKAALASAEVLGKSLICKQDEKNQFDKVNSNFQSKDPSKLKEPVSEVANKLPESSQEFHSSSTDETKDYQNKEEKQIDQDATKPTTIKTDDWLIQSFSKLEGQQETKDFSGIECDKSNEVENASNKTYDSKANSSNTTKNESDDSDNTTQDADSEFYSGKERGTNHKKDKNLNMKQKLSTNLKSVSILQKPREYCQSRGKPWDKARDFSYQMPLHKGDTRNLHKNPANWIKYNRKCINRQTLFKLQDILNNLSKMESNNNEMHKESGSRNQTASRIININAINYKLKSHIYENIDQILIDIRQMFVNSRESNKESSNTTELTTKLEIFFNELVEKHFGKPDSSDSREPSNQNASSLAMKNRRTQKVQRKMN